MEEKVRLNRQQANRVLDYVETFGTEAGKRVLEDLEKMFGGECYVRGDPNETLYRAYKRDILIWMKDMIKKAEMGIEIEKEQEEE